MTRAKSVSLGFIAAAFIGSAVFAQSAGDIYQGPPSSRRQHSPTNLSQEVNRKSSNDSLLMVEDKPRYSGRGTVSLHDLNHKVAAKALKEFERAHRYVDAHKLEKAVEHFTNAVEIDAEFTDARNDLANCYIKLVRAGDAIRVLTAATSEGTGNALSYTNLAIAHMMLNDRHSAEEAARKGAEMDRLSTRPKLILALTLVMDDRFTDETTSLLRSAESDFPQAILLLGRALAARGDIEGAKAKMTAYLASGEESGRGLAQEWLDSLNEFTNRTRAAVR